MHTIKYVAITILLVLITYASSEEAAKNQSNLTISINDNKIFSKANDDDSEKNEKTTTPEKVSGSEERAPFGTYEFWLYSLIATGLTLLAGLMSGLTVGYLSIDELVLELKIKNGNDEERKQSEEILKILEQHHLLLVTLLVANSAAMEALPICLNKLVPELWAIILSVTAVLIFGEILPQAICTGPNQIPIAAALAPYTQTLMMMEGFIAYPISLVLDKLLGEHSKSRYQNSDLKALIELHTQNAMEELVKEKETGLTGLSKEQSQLIRGAIDITNLMVKDSMKKYDKVETVDSKQILTERFLKDLAEKGYSRYPVWRGDKNNVIGILLVKKLLGFNRFDMSLENLNIPLRMPLIVHPERRLSDLLVEFQKGKSHIALVTEQTEEMKRNMGLGAGSESRPMNFDDAMRPGPAVILGIITLEDVVEKVLGEQILDEIDYDKEHLAYLLPPMRKKPELKASGLESRVQTMKTDYLNTSQPALTITPDVQGRKNLCKDIIANKGSQLLDMLKRAESKTALTPSISKTHPTNDLTKSQVLIPMKPMNDKSVPLLQNNNKV